MAKRYIASVDRTQYVVLIPGPPLGVVYFSLVHIPDTAQSGNNCSELQSSALPSVLA